jgi:hypothetical protein
VWVQVSKKRWKSRITYDGKQYNLGRFDTKQEAALAYDREARQCGKGKPLNYDSIKAAAEAVQVEEQQQQEEQQRRQQQQQEEEEEEEMQQQQMQQQTKLNRSRYCYQQQLRRLQLQHWLQRPQLYRQPQLPQEQRSMMSPVVLPPLVFNPTTRGIRGGGTCMC